MQFVCFCAEEGETCQGEVERAGCTQVTEWHCCFSSHPFPALHWLYPDVPIFPQHPQNIPLFNASHFAAALYFALVIVQNPFKDWAHDSNKTQDMHEEILPTGEENPYSTNCSPGTHCASSLGFTASHFGFQLCYPHRTMSLAHHRCCMSSVWWWHLGATNVYLGQNLAATSFSVSPSPRHYV